MPLERVLLRAGRTGYTYPELLEVRRGSVQILVPSAEAKRRLRISSTVVALAYVFIAGQIFATFAIPGTNSAAVAVVVVMLYFIGLVAILVWWERWSLPLLAEGPAAAIPLELLGAQSYGTFQEIRARAEGEEVRVAVSGSRERLDEAVRLAGFSIHSP